MGENEPLAMFKTLILKMIKSITHEIKIVMCMEAPALAIRDCWATMWTETVITNLDQKENPNVAMERVLRQTMHQQRRILSKGKAIKLTEIRAPGKEMPTVDGLFPRTIDTVPKCPTPPRLCPKSRTTTCWTSSTTTNTRAQTNWRQAKMEENYLDSHLMPMISIAILRAYSRCPVTLLIRSRWNMLVSGIKTWRT